MNALCGPKFLRGITALCDGSCCGLGKDGKPDRELTERVNRRAEAWRRIVGADILSRPGADCSKASLCISTRLPAARDFLTLNGVPR
jgi:hypothetical protein